MKAQKTTKKPGNGDRNLSKRHSVRKIQTVRTKRVRPLTPKQLIDIIEHMNDGVMVLDKDWHFTYVNQKAANMLHRQSPADLIGKNIWVEYPDDGGEPFHRVYERSMREQIPIEFEEYYAPWGLWFENRIHPSPDRLLVLFTEITERKKTELLLQERQYFLQKIMDTEPGTVYIYDIDEQRSLYINRDWLPDFGYSEEDRQVMGAEPFAYILHPEDRELLAEHYEHWRDAAEGAVREIEYRVRTKTGEWHWLHNHEAIFLREDNGRVKQILGINYSVTERRSVQEALRRSEQQLALIYDTILDITFLLSIEPDSRFRFVSVNKAFLQVTGLKSDQVIGRYADEIIPPDSQALVFGNYRRAIEEKRPVTWEETSEYPSGKKIAIVTVNGVHDDRGICTHLVGAVHDITERKQMEAVVVKERDLSDAMLNSLPSIFYLFDETGTFLRWNRNFELVSGYSSEEIAHMHPLDFFEGEDRELVTQKILYAFEHGESYVEANFVSKNRHRTLYLFTGRRVELEGRPYLIGMGIDISERKRTEEALAASEAEMRALFTAMNDVVMVIDQNGVYRKVAPTNPALLYRPRNELLGRSMRDIFPAEQAESFIHSIQWVIRTQQLAHIEYQLEIAGETLWFDASISPMDEDSVLWMARDITGRKRAEERLRQLNEELEQRVALRTEELAAAMVRAQESDRLKSAFLASMSHELRTPLNSIIGFTGVILQGLAGPLNPEQTKQLNMTRDSARHLLALINDVLDISKIEAGQLDIIKRPFEMRQAVESALRVILPLAQKKNLPVSTSIGSTVGMLRNDRRRVEQVLINLINNAIKFTEHGEVRVSCQVRDGWLVTSVHDDGIGIKPEDLDKLFKPFQQIDTGPARIHEGTGLGLAICKRLVTAMGGEIAVESQWGTGSTFTFSLPLEGALWPES